MLKANTRDTPSRDEFNDLTFRLDRVLSDLTAKVDGRCKCCVNKCICVDFEEFEELIRKRLDEQHGQVLQKANIKDVCALLDMKSSKYS